MFYFIGIFHICPSLEWLRGFNLHIKDLMCLIKYSKNNDKRNNGFSPKNVQMLGEFRVKLMNVSSDSICQSGGCRRPQACLCGVYYERATWTPRVSSGSLTNVYHILTPTAYIRRRFQNFASYRPPNLTLIKPRLVAMTTIIIMAFRQIRLSERKLDSGFPFISYLYRPWIKRRSALFYFVSRWEEGEIENNGT